MAYRTLTPAIVESLLESLKAADKAEPPHHHHVLAVAFKTTNGQLDKTLPFELVTSFEGGDNPELVVQIAGDILTEAVLRTQEKMRRQLKLAITSGIAMVDAVSKAKSKAEGGDDAKPH